MPMAAADWGAGGDINSPFDGGSRLAAKKLDFARITTTWNTQRLTLPHASVAVQMTVVVPTGNMVPDEGEHLIVTRPPELSVAVTLKFTTAPAGLTGWTGLPGGQLVTCAM